MWFGILAFSCVAAAQPSIVYTLNLTGVASQDPISGYETLHLASAVAGLVNRDEPLLNYFFQDSDSYWWSYATKKGGWLDGTTVKSFQNLSEAILEFAPKFKGIVVYEMDVYPTALLAGTSAGVENLLPVAENSTWFTFLVHTVKLPVKRSLVGMFGPGGSHRTTSSIKGDAYSWAMQQWLKKGDYDDDLSTPLLDDDDRMKDDDYHPLDVIADGNFLGYFVDSYAAAHPATDFYVKTTLLNHDWIVARSGFFFDLDVWPDEVPVDDPGQKMGTDLATFLEMLELAYNQTHGVEWTHIAGFTPWAYKYVSNHGGVATEWQTARLTSSYNAFVDADACCIGDFSTASFWQHYPLPRHLPATARPSHPDDLVAKGLLTFNGTDYVANPGKMAYFFYLGDFDSAAWLQSQIPHMWDDPNRGSVPVSWPIDPILTRRFPPAFDMLWSSATSNDTFTTGDSGVGYINPPQLLAANRVNISNLPSAVDSWYALSTTLYSRLNVGFTGFLINGAAGSMTPESEDAYLPFSADGMVELGFPGVVSHIAEAGTLNTPVFPHTDIPTTQADAVKLIVDQFHSLVPSPTSRSDAHMYRSVLTSPTYLQGVEQAVAQQTNNAAVALKAQDVGAFLRAVFGKPHVRVAYIDDTLPSEWPVIHTGLNLSHAACNTGPGYNLNVTLRNDGWTNITSSDHRLAVTVQLYTTHRYYGPPRRSAPPGSYEIRGFYLRLALGPHAHFLQQTTYTIPLTQDLIVAGPPVTVSGYLGGQYPGTCTFPGLDHMSIVVVNYTLVNTNTGTSLADTGSPPWIEAFHVHRN